MERLTAQEIVRHHQAHPADAIILVMDPEGKLEEYEEIIQQLENSRFRIFQILDPENWLQLIGVEGDKGGGQELREVLNGGLIVANESPDTTSAVAADYLERLRNGPFTLFNGGEYDFGNHSALYTPELTAASVRKSIKRILEWTVLITLDEPVEANILACD
jgi:hypothetical protein